jgi:hyaluronan synthase
MPGSEFLHLLVLYIPLGLIGLWRWSFWLVRRIGAAAYRPNVGSWPEGEKFLKVSVVTPVYNEDPELFDQAVRSWQRNGVHEIVAVIDKSNVKHIMRCQRQYVDDPTSTTKFRLIVTPKPGKRAALCDGIELATGDLIALVDSDTVWDDDVVEKTIPHFQNPRIGAATLAQRISNPDTVANVLFDMLLWSRYREEVPFLLGMGRVFNTLSGRTAFYRREALLDPNADNMHDLRHEFFFGARAISGDDKRLSHLVIREGWETAYVRGPLVYTQGLGSIKDFIKQRLRWTRNSWRADLRAVAQGWVWAHPALALFMIDRFALPFLMLVGPVVFTLSVLAHEYFVAGTLIIWWLISRFIRAFGYFRMHPNRVVYLPAYIIYGYVNAALKIYALGTLRENSWATRWSQKRAARKTRGRKNLTLIEGLVTISIAAFVLTHLALSFRSQVGADVDPQPTYSRVALQSDINKYKGDQSAPPRPTNPVEQNEIGTYVVKVGDTPQSVVEKLGTDRNTLKRINNIRDLDRISVGQELHYFKKAGS